MARIALGGFQHEAHSFVAHRADFAYFAEHRDRPPLVRGDDLLAALRGGAYALSGVLAALAADDVAVPLVWASGGAGGVVTDDAFERIAGELVGRLSAALPVDAVYLDLHGAMVAERFDDAEGELLRRVKAAVGAATPVVASLDYHANLSPAMVEHCDALAVCRTYPHIDRFATGRRAAAQLRRLLQDGVPAGRALRKTAFLLPLDFQCTLVEPSAAITGWQPPADPALIAAEYAAGFPPSDTVWCGPAVAVHALTQAAADAAADAYLRFIEQHEADFAAPLWPLDTGIGEALARARTAARPVIIADTCDNPGAGGSADTTGILAALIAAGADHVLAGYFCDPEAAAAARLAGVGAQIELALGGRHGPAGVVPLAGRYEVLALADGPFEMTGRVAGQVTADLGAMALLRRDGVRIAVTSRRVQAYDPAPFARLGADPATARILVLKSSCHFRADFAPLADSVLTVVAPGAYDPDPANYPYRRLRAGVRMQPG
ncbi:MAG: M81 family metallopeptidase [Lautropia sp.]